MNPFQIPDRPNGNDRPLCPWEDPKHEGYYVPVDNTALAYQGFLDYVTTSDYLIAQGKVVLVGGRQGCGKTALIYRCAHWLKQALRTEKGIDLQIIDLSTEAITGMSLDSRIKHICERILDELELAAVFSEAEIGALEKRRLDPAVLYPYLGRVLANKTIAIAVALPEIELAEELRRYAALVKKSLVFFAESSYEDVQQIASQAARIDGRLPVLHLTVGVLSIEDGWRFVESRLKNISDTQQVVPLITEETLRRVMEVRTREGGRVNIRELELVCRNVFEIAISKAADTIGYVDFLEYYARKAAG